MNISTRLLFAVMLALLFATCLNAVGHFYYRYNPIEARTR